MFKTDMIFVFFVKSDITILGPHGKIFKCPLFQFYVLAQFQKGT